MTSNADQANASGQAKLDRPHAHFATPQEVVAEPALSKVEKASALDKLEQDARQMSAAANEGMADGEPGDLQAVLDAQATLEATADATAYDVVIADLRLRRSAGPPGGISALLDHAIGALEALENSPAKQPFATQGDRAAGSEAEIAEEAALEKLDP